MLAPPCSQHEVTYTTAHKGPCLTAAFSHDGKLAASASADSSIKVCCYVYVLSLFFHFSTSFSRHCISFIAGSVDFLSSQYLVGYTWFNYPGLLLDVEFEFACLSGLVRLVAHILP